MPTIDIRETLVEFPFEPYECQLAYMGGVLEALDGAVSCSSCKMHPFPYRSEPIPEPVGCNEDDRTMVLAGIKEGLSLDIKL